MAQWYIKEMGELTGVSVRTLHHYDKISLLKPSLRLSNGYRVYSEADLVKLEQIVALKFFGFSLAHIKKMVCVEVNLMERLSLQHALLHEQIEHLQKVAVTLRGIMSEQKNYGSVQWKHIITIIKEYTMTNYLAKSWEAKVYTEEQLKELAHITAQYTENELRDYHRRWQNVWAEVKESLNQDPASPIGKQLATTWFGLVDELYGNHEDLKNAARKAYMDNKIPDVPFDKAIHDWIEKAVKAHGIQWPSKKK